MLSIVIPFYKRYKQFVDAFVFNVAHFKNPNVQVVLSMDAPTDAEKVVRLALRYPSIRWKIVCNPNDHVWRSPAKAINVGIRHSDGERILVVSPESVFINDVPHLLEKEVSATAYAIGQVGWVPITFYQRFRADIWKLADDKNFYGSICALKSHLEQLRGYDESNTAWGADDDNIRVRLRMIGAQPIKTTAKLIHPGEKTRVPERSAARLAELDRLLRPNSPFANSEDWGKDFNHVILS